jgi:hypothetical protein
VRAARLTDLAAVGELSRQAHAPDAAEAPHTGVRTLGLPVSGSHISVFSLFRLPLGALLATDLMYVYEDSGRVTGFARVEHDSLRDEWTIVELDALDDEGTAGDIQYRLVQRLLKDASKRGGVRFHVACADDAGNVELFMQAGFARYGEERILYRAPDIDAPRLPADSAADAAIRPAASIDALQLDRLYRRATPAPVARLEDYRLKDWERQGGSWRVPRSSLAPILRFADVEAFVQQEPPPGDGLVAFCQVGVAKEEQPHYLKVVTRPEQDPTDLIDYGLAVIADRTRTRWVDRARPQRTDRGVISTVRTYEAPLDRRFEERGFSTVAEVSLLMRENAERVREPALVPVTSR